MEIFLSSPSVDWPHSENEKENGEDDNRHIEDKDSGYLSNYATRFQKFHFWSNMVNLFNLEVPFLSEI